MKQCDSLGCTKPAKVQKVIGAAFSMSSTSTNSKSVKMLCFDCNDAEKRAEQLGGRASIGRS